MAGSPAPGDESGGGAPSGPAKRHLDDSVSSPTKKRCCDEPSTSAEWGYLCPEPGSTCFMTPTKNYEKRSCRKLSPRSPKPISPKETLDRTPVRVSPSKVRIVSFTLNSPTKNLPDFVRDGEAPHLRLMSPLRKKRDNPDWLTLMARERRRDTDKPPAMAPLSPKESLPTHRNSTSEKTPKSAKKARTLLNYFNVSVKEK